MIIAPFDLERFEDFLDSQDEALAATIAGSRRRDRTVSAADARSRLGVSARKKR